MLSARTILILVTLTYLTAMAVAVRVEAQTSTPYEPEPFFNTSEPPTVQHPDARHSILSGIAPIIIVLFTLIILVASIRIK